MPDTKISNMTAASTLTGSELVAGVQGGANVKITADQQKTWSSNAPTLVTPVLGVATATSINKVALTAPATAATLTIADGKTLTASASITITGTDGKSFTVTNSGTVAGGDAWVLAIAAGKTLTVSNTITLAGTDATVMTFPSTSATIARTDAANAFTGVQTVAATTATPAGGSADARLLFGTTAGFGIYYGSGAPSSLTAGQGSLYLRSDGTGVADRAYINNSSGSGTTWTAIATAS